MTRTPPTDLPILRYEADSEGRVYAEYRDGAILPTGWVIPDLRSQSNISPATFTAHTTGVYE